MSDELATATVQSHPGRRTVRCVGAAPKYSKTLQAWEGVWTYEDLSTYLYGPTLTTPGVSMETPGVPDETERVDLIAYLRTLSDNPFPLP